MVTGSDFHLSTVLWRATRETQLHDYDVPNTGTLKAVMQVLFYGERRGSYQHDYGVPNTGTLRAARLAVPCFSE